MTARTTLAVTSLAAAVALIASAPSASFPVLKSPGFRPVATHVHLAEAKRLRAKIRMYIRDTAYWRSQALLPPVRVRSGRQLAGATPLRRQLRQWRQRDQWARLHAKRPPHLVQWLCIHSGIKGGRWSRTLDYLGGGVKVGWGEAPWHYNGKEHGSIYDNGLQMDQGFQREYAPAWLLKTPAYKWSPWQQMWVAERAVKTRGFGPWPNTARVCGLLP